MKHCFLVMLFSTLCACGGGTDRSPVAVGPDHREAGGNRWFPLQYGTIWIYEGEDDGQRVAETLTVHAQEYLPGVGYCTPVWQERRLASVLVERTVEWFLVDAAGDVWRAGEDAFELHEGVLTRTGDSWRAGENGLPVLPYLPADPREGDRFAIALPSGRETFLISSEARRVVVPAGAFSGCLEVTENAGSADQDIILFAPGIGIVQEQWETGHKVLVEHQQPR